MRTVHDVEEMTAIEQERSLISVYVDRAYDQEKIEWLIKAREGFDHHARDSWHLLIPLKHGYGVDSWIQPDQYGVAFAADLIEKLEIEFAALPCIVFRALGEECYYLKLGGFAREQFFEEIGLIADLARRCHAGGPDDPNDFRKYVNKRIASHLRRRKLLSATHSALPVLGTLLGGVVNLAELV
ncbi:MAG: hypothetical protein NXI17_12310 [Alphaproteobacteria bacterium]|nr:hypothetical protein [Alphaproteobacteria bacterium]